jgi:hypothetical protein
MDIEGEEEWEVDQILGERTRKGERQFYVRWKGFGEADDSWEPEEYLEHAREKIASWRRGAGE